MPAWVGGKQDFMATSKEHERKDKTTLSTCRVPGGLKPKQDNNIDEFRACSDSFAVWSREGVNDTREAADARQAGHDVSSVQFIRSQ